MDKASRDSDLGRRVAERLDELGLESPISFEVGMDEHAPIRSIWQELMLALGLDLSNASLKDSPDRVAKMFREEIFYGMNYSQFPKCTTVPNDMKVDEVVTAERIEVNSMCEHHFVPFMGDAYIAYIPSTKILGLSKFNRVVDFFARRPQIQERLTEQISAALRFIVETEDVAVILRCNHLCTRMRGVKAKETYTTTSKMSGRFFTNPGLRGELLQLIRR